MPAPGLDLNVIFYDLKAKCQKSNVDTLSQILFYKGLYRPKDMFHIFLVNSSRTYNDKGYAGISFVDSDLPAILEHISNAECDGNSDLLDVFNLGISVLSHKATNTKVKYNNFRFIFITDLLSFDSSVGIESINQIANDMKKNNISVCVIGPSVEPPTMIQSKIDITEWMRSFEPPDNDPNLKMMKQLVNHLPHSVICSYSLGLHFLHNYKDIPVSRPSLQPLDFGNYFDIKIKTSRIGKAELPYTIKNKSVRPSRKWVCEDQENVQIDIEDTIRGIIRHDKFVKLDNDPDRFKAKIPRSFTVLGFTDAKNVPEYYLQSNGSYFVYLHEPESTDASNFFNTLIEELLKMKKYGIARMVTYANCNPKYMALIPRNGPELYGFIATDLPFADDIAFPYDEKDNSLAVKTDIENDVKRFLDGIDVTKDDCKIKVPLAFKMMINENAMSVFKLLNKQFNNKYESCDSGKNWDFINDLKSFWPERVLEENDQEQIASKENGSATVDFNDVGDEFNF